MNVNNTGKLELIEKLKDKKVLYIATKNEDYLRLQQEIKLIQKYSAQSTIIVSKSKSYLKRILYVWLKLLAVSSRKYDVIMVGFMAQMIIPFWNWKFKNCLLIVDFFISVYDTLVDDRKKVSAESYIGKWIYLLDRATLRPANCIICDTKAHGEYFSDKFKVEENKFLVMYLEADDNYYFPMKIVKPKQWEDKFLVLYFGSILPVQGVDIVMKAIDLLQQEKNIFFIIIGPIGDREKKAESDNVIYIEWLQQQMLAKYIAFSDLCLAGHFSNKVGKAKRTIPGKAYIYQAMEKKIVLGDSPANRELFEESDKYLYVPQGDPSSLKDIILRQYMKSKGEEQ